MKKRYIYIAIAILVVVSMGAFLNSTIYSKVISSNIFNRQTINITTDCDWVSYPNIEELKNNSKVIVTGKVISAGKSIRKDKKIILNETLPKEKKDEILKEVFPYQIYTESEIAINDVIKGQLKQGDKIKIQQLGGSYGNINQIVDGVEYFSKGDEAIFFLNDAGEPNTYVTLNAYQGHINIKNGIAKPNKFNHLFTQEKSKDDMLKSVK